MTDTAEVDASISAFFATELSHALDVDIDEHRFDRKSDVCAITVSNMRPGCDLIQVCGTIRQKTGTRSVTVKTGRLNNAQHIFVLKGCYNTFYRRISTTREKIIKLVLLILFGCAVHLLYSKWYQN